MDRRVTEFETILARRMQTLSARSQKTMDPDVLLIMRGKMDALRTVREDFAKAFGLELPERKDDYRV